MNKNVSSTMRRRKEWIALSVMRLSMSIVAFCLIVLLAYIVYRGFGVLSWQFLTQPPTEAMTKGGIFPALLGTFYLTAGSILIAFPLGVATAIYLNEYAKSRRIVRIVRFGVNNLAGVPSVVFGLFGLAFFVIYLDFGSSILSGSLTLAILILPVIIGAAEESLKSVPRTFREASIALGATKWQTISRVVLPAALPGMLTGSILGVGRAAGETAPIMFTAAAFFTSKLPSSIFEEVMALPYHIYVLATAGTHIEQTRPIQYGTALVLIALVIGINSLAVSLRTYLRRRQGY
jgi:phosphate transport system permease protein